MTRHHRTFRRDPPASPLDKAKSLSSQVAQLTRTYGRTDRRTLDAREVELDAWLEAGDGSWIRQKARRLELDLMADTGRRWPYGVSPPHGIYLKGFTMADLRRKEREAGFYWFANSARGEKYYGPYLGFGGVFFAAKILRDASYTDAAGTFAGRLYENRILRVAPTFAIQFANSVKYGRIETARREAQEMARG